MAQGHGARHLTLGQRGEQVAAAYVEQQLGCTVLARNWRCRGGELDIVAYDGERVVVCEVKTRSGLGFGEPAEAITRDKMIRIKRLARKWLSEYQVPPNRSVRFDVIGVLIPPGGRPLVQHIPGAFE